jgi:ADP-ribosylglycohydrolase
LFYIENSSSLWGKNILHWYYAFAPRASLIRNTKRTTRAGRRRHARKGRQEDGMIPKDYPERLYAGWLAKIIGIRLGVPVEGWTYQKIKDVYGELRHYPVNYNEFAADDDSNGPLFFLRALGDLKPGRELTAQDVGEALLNYAPFEHGFFWWGGYGVSTEHTAYLNLRNGIRAPRSGSIEQNGATVAEQIGGQIFIDTWGLVAPGNPELAARYAREAASVTHGGNGVYGGIFVAVCVSLAFVERDIQTILQKALSYIPQDCEYARAVRHVMGYHAKNPGSWRDCFRYIFDNFGYDRYPGSCHIIPNISVMVLALLYGGGDFSDTLNICNMCGWDTDCNVGNVATIMGVLRGIEGIADEWIQPVHDLLICSSCVGSLNIMDVPYGASYIAMLAYRAAGEPLPEPWREILEKRIDSCHFEYPGSTHSLRARVQTDPQVAGQPEIALENTEEAAFTGRRALKMRVTPAPQESGKVCLYKRTHYQPGQFFDSRYDPSFSPLLYPGQTVHGAAFIPEYSPLAYVRLYAREQRTGREYLGERALLEKGRWLPMRFKIPPVLGGLLDEAGFLFEMAGECGAEPRDFTALVDNLYFDGAPDYSVEFENETEEVWSEHHREISQFTRVKGLAYLAEGRLHLSCADFAEIYTGRHDWADYTAEFALMPVVGGTHMVNVRVQGAIRSYAVALMEGGKLALRKNAFGYITLTEAPLDWKPGEEYVIRVRVKGNRIEAGCAGAKIDYTDESDPYLTGAVGVSVLDGSHASYRYIRIHGE